MARRDEGAYLKRSVTEEQRRKRAGTAATRRAVPILPGCGVARSSRVACDTLLARA
jgi:hypothetical protein